MDTIEEGLKRIDEHNISAINKHKELFSKAISDSASISNKCSKNLYNEFNKIFPEIDKLNDIKTSIFNPITVIEFRDNKAYQIIDTWDKDNGLLPERKVMGDYYVDIGNSIKNNELFCKTHNTNMGKVIISKNTTSHLYSKLTKDLVYACGCKLNDTTLNIGGNITNPSVSHNTCRTHNKLIGKVIIPDDNNLYSTLTPNLQYECGCKINNNSSFNNTINPINCNPDISRLGNLLIDGQNIMSNFYCKRTSTFQVDNYLNLYHSYSGLYLMFNKTSFPSIPFHFKTNKYNQVVVYDSKKLENLNNPKLLDKSYHSSIDTRSTFLNDINSIIPYDIVKSYDFFNRFRQFKNFTFENTNIDLLISTPETSTDYDPRDKLIESYKQRLETTTKRADNAEKIMQTMLEEYEQKTVDIKTINFELQQHKLELLEKQSQYKLELLEKQSQYKKDLLENETKQILSYVNTIEELKNNNFRLNQQLLEIETYKSKTDTMGLSIETLKKENAITLLSLEKQKALTDKLITQLKTEKTKNDVIIQQNTEYKNNYMSLETNYTFIKNDLLKLEEQIKDKTLECSKMSDTLKQLGNTSSDALENALSDKLETLNTTNTLLKEENSKLNIEYNKVSKQLEKLQSTLKNMLE